MEIVINTWFFSTTISTSALSFAKISEFAREFAKGMLFCDIDVFIGEKCVISFMFTNGKLIEAILN